MTSYNSIIFEIFRRPVIYGIYLELEPPNNLIVNLIQFDTIQKYLIGPVAFCSSVLIFTINHAAFCQITVFSLLLTHRSNFFRKVLPTIHSDPRPVHHRRTTCTKIILNRKEKVTGYRTCRCALQSKLDGTNTTQKTQRHVNMRIYSNRSQREIKCKSLIQDSSKIYCIC